MKDKERTEYLWAMSEAPKIGTDVHWFQMLLPAFFTAIIITMVRMATYTRPMKQFYWTNSEDTLTDFFSYYKMIAVCVCGVLALVFLAYRVFAQNMSVKRTVIYVPMLVYTAFVLISYAASDYKEFSWLGWNDRFEGTAVLLCYMIMLFYVINSVNTEKSVKWIVYPVGVASALLGLLGLSQGIDKDFFRTVVGQKLIVPNSMTSNGVSTWDLIEQAAANGEKFLNFTFTNKQIYQTVYNINYVSFYLTLLIPLFGLIFIYCAKKGKEVPVWKTAAWCGLFALLIYNLIGSASSGGFLGMAVVVLLALILMNRKIINWIKPLAVLIAITLLVGGVTYERWMPELTGAVNSVKTQETAQATEQEENRDSLLVTQAKVDYIKTEGSVITVSYDGEVINIDTAEGDVSDISATDGEGSAIAYLSDQLSIHHFEDERFADLSFKLGIDDNDRYYLILDTNGKEWPFRLGEEAVLVNDMGKEVQLENVPHIGWENNTSFGSGRGYIWSRTLPMMKHTALVGYGADTYCIYFPHKDYIGKMQSPSYTNNYNIIVDKPHNMYMGMWVGTGGISVIAFLAILVIYAYQSIRWIWRCRFETFLDFAGAGIFLGIMGFAVSGLVNDSTVSVMPMFYGLLGTGIAVNIIQAQNMKEETK
ncbi:MAG: hypothetical protein ACI4LO_09680 [Anaerovoracaceae bacterium]